MTQHLTQIKIATYEKDNYENAHQKGSLNGSD